MRKFDIYARLKITALAIGLIFCCAKLAAQTTVDCNELLKRAISTDDPQQALRTITHVKCFGMDSIDLKIFGNGPILGSLMMSGIQQSKNDKLTYGDLLIQINRMKNDAGYPKMRRGIIVMNTLERTKATPATWATGRKLLKEIETSDEEVDKLHNFMLRNPGKKWNYHELVVYWNAQEKINDKKNKP
jgi:hypothetical protein